MGLYNKLFGGMLDKGRVNMVITKRSIRYSHQETSELDSITHYGEKLFPPNTMDGGKIKNKDAFIRTLQRIMNEHEWNRKDVAFSVVDDTVFIRDIAIPGSLNHSEALSYVETQIGHQIQLPFDNPSLSIVELDKDDTTTHVRIFAYPKDKVNEISQLLESVGFRPIIADLTTLSIFRYYYHTIKDRPKHVLLAHLNQKGLYLTAFENNQAMFSRHIRVDTPRRATDEQINTIISDSLLDIGRMLEFSRDSIFKGRGSIGKVIVSGDFPKLDKFSSSISESFKIPVYDFVDEHHVIDDIDADNIDGNRLKDFKGGKYGRSTRVLSSDLEKILGGNFDDDKSTIYKYIDLLGLGLKKA